MATFFLEEGKKNVGPLIQIAFGCVIDAIGRQIAYAREYEQSVKDLEDKQATTSWVQAQANNAIQEGEDRVSISLVNKLKKDEKPLIDKAAEVVREFNDLEATTGFTCCGGIPNVWRRYRIGRKAKKCSLEIDEFRTKKGSAIIAVEMRPGEVTEDSLLNIFKPKACELQSRVDVMNEIIPFLKDDSIQQLGLWGMEGSGKSMLINQVLYRVREEKLLQCVYVQVPQNQENLGVIQEEIQKLIFKEIYPKSSNDSVEKKQRADQIRLWFNSNTEKKAVVILDGLRQQIDLEEIGIPNNDSKVCDVILTARDMDLLVSDMGLSIERTFHVKPLSLEESKNLFLYFVRRSGQTIDEDKRVVAGELVKCSGGLPKLIKEQASILTNQCDIYAWHDALREIKSQSATKMLKPVLKILYDWSSNKDDRNEITSLFSLCGLFEESSISVEDLTIHHRALGMLAQNMTVKETKDRVKRLLHVLRARSLIDGDNNKVNINELFRQVAALIASSQGYHVMRNGGNYMNEKWSIDQLRMLSTDDPDIFKAHPELKSLVLKMLQLGSEHRFTRIDDDELFDNMKELEGLHLRQVSFVSRSSDSSPSFPSTDGKLGNLHTLCLINCGLKNVSNICHLKKLQILKISGLDIIEMPKDVKHLTNLRSLDLRGCCNLQVIKNGTFKTLKRLEELFLDDCFDRWGEQLHKSRFKNASLNELKECTSLSTLHVYIPKSTLFPQNLELEKLEKYKILLGNVRKHSKEIEGARTLRPVPSDSTSMESVDAGSLRSDPSDSTSMESVVAGSLRLDLSDSTSMESVGAGPLRSDLSDFTSKESVSARTLRLDLSDSTSILWDEGLKSIMYKATSLCLKGMLRMPKPSIHQLCSPGFPCLQDLHLENCDSVEYIVESSDSVLAFPNLETLTLVKLKNLRKICSGPFVDESFGRLNEVAIETCDALENLFDFSMIKKFSALKKIQIKDCRNMTAIVKNDIRHNGGKGQKIIWDKLRHLSLENLEKTMSFCIAETSPENERPNNLTTAFFDGELISFPGLETLSLTRLPRVRNIWQLKQLPELSNLQSLTVKGFEASKFKDILFCPPRSTPGQESALQRLALVFSCLEREHIALHHGTLYTEGHLQNLHDLIVYGCERLTFLFTASMAQALPHLTKLTIARCRRMMEVIQVDNEDKCSKSIDFQKLTSLCLGSLENLTAFSKGNISISFPSLESLKISHCHNLTALFTDSRTDSRGGEAMDSRGGEATGSRGGEATGFRGGEATGSRGGEAMDSRGGEAMDSRAGEATGSRGGEATGSRGGEARTLFHSKFCRQEPPPFPCLDNLVICNMNMLERIWQCPAREGEESGGSSLWKTFLKIKKLHIEHCILLENILDAQFPQDANTLDAQLNYVYLNDLTRIRHIWGINDAGGRKIHYRFLQTVFLCRCRGIEFLFPASMTKDLLRLQSIKVELCNGIRHLIQQDDSLSENDPPQFFFPDVKILKLQELQNLTTFYEGPHCSEWPALENLLISKCDNIKIFGFEYDSLETSSQDSLDSQPLFSVNKDSFCRLSTLELSQNRLMKQIWHGSCPSDFFKKLEFFKLICSNEERDILLSEFPAVAPYLKSLHLNNLHLLIPKQFGLSLQEVELNMIPNISNLDTPLLLTPLPSRSFECLTVLKVSNCHSLAFLFKFRMVKSLGCLTKLTIANCGSMEFVVKRERGKNEDEAILHKLECLTLESLQGLTSFCKGSYKFQFPSLEEVTIRECPEMTMFTKGETATPNLSKMDLNGMKIDLDDKCNLNEIIQKKG